MSDALPPKMEMIMARFARAARLSLLAGGVVIAAVAVAGCGSADLDDAKAEHRAFAFSGRTLTVDSDNSQLELVPGSGKDVQVTRWFAGWSVGGETKASWELEQGTLKLREHCGGISSDCRSKHRVEVPRGVAVVVKDGNGQVTVRDLTEDVQVSSGNGRIVAQGLKGEVRLRSGNGEVTGEGLAGRKVRAESGNGRIRLSLDKPAEQVTAESDNGEVKITVPEAKYKVDAGSHNGQVHIGVKRDDDSRYALSAHSGNGAVRLETAG
ncbi:DUF4097 family beta strand repeat-containing protein [Streptomyces orinoci]|uniref:DUF4097 family beta strand repeat-containing protein n=1 Tax=Streptomyces orinoci TaxID=67339 RepID=A0ABV3JPT6_STRON|nr:DUF4097 family beta strand repeat-containing protein [Streptomyces orinoci]